MKTILISIVLIALTAFNTVCNCNTTIDEMYENNEIVFIAEPIENIHPEKDVKVAFDKRRSGINVYMRLKKIIKGDIQVDSLVIYQENGCVMDFKFGTSYIVFGNQINQFKNVKRDKNIIIVDGEEVELEEYEIQNNVLTIYNDENKRSDFWNKQTSIYTIVETDLCRVGVENGNLYKSVLKIK